MRVPFTDYDFLDTSLERDIFREAGMELIEAQCRTEHEVIDAGFDCRAMLIQYASMRLFIRWKPKSNCAARRP